MSFERARNSGSSVSRAVKLVFLLTTADVLHTATHAFQQIYAATRSKHASDITHIAPPSFQSFSGKSNNLVQYVTIYEFDDNGQEFKVEEDFDPITSSFEESGSDSDLKQLVAERISSEFPPSFLANLACAQAPPPHNQLMPKDCISAELISVNGRGAEIAVSTLASAGGDGRCVQIMIPVKFGTSSSSTKEEPTVNYIVKQLKQLESTSLESIAKKEWEKDHADQFTQQEKIIFELKDEASLTEEALPDWWTFCELNQGLQEESDSMKDLLNEDDFATDLNVLFQSNYHGESSIQAIKTCVTSIGPSGVYLRSYAERQEETDEKYFIAELSIPFAEKAPTRDDLRTSILTMIETAGEPLVTPVEEALVDASATTAAEEVRLIETTTTPVTTIVVLDKACAFQEQLLRARIQVDHRAIQRRRAQKEEALHRSLLAARLSMEKKTVPAKQPITEEELAAKYARIETLGERAFQILRDLNMI